MIQLKQLDTNNKYGDTMEVQIKINKHNYERTEWDKSGKVIMRRYYDLKYLSATMESLAKSAEPDKHETLLKQMRISYKLFGAKTFTFSRRKDINE